MQCSHPRVIFTVDSQRSMLQQLGDNWGKPLDIVRKVHPITYSARRYHERRHLTRISNIQITIRRNKALHMLQAVEHTCIPQRSGLLLCQTQILKKKPRHHVHSRHNWRKSTCPKYPVWFQECKQGEVETAHESLHSQSRNGLEAAAWWSEEKVKDSTW